MSRFSRNEFYYDSYGERYRKKSAWTPENEDWYYKDFGGVPYNPQQNTYENDRFLRRKGIPNSFTVENDNDNRPGFRPNRDVFIYREPMAVAVPIRIQNRERVRNDRVQRGVEILEPQDRRTVVVDDRPRHDTQPDVLEGNIQRRDTIEIDDEINQMNDDMPNRNNERTVVRVPTLKKIRSWNADNPIENKVLRTRMRSSGTVEVNPRFKHKVRIERVGLVKEPRKAKMSRVMGHNNEIKKRIAEWKRLENTKNQIKREVIGEVTPKIKQIEDRLGTELKERDKIAEDNFKKYVENNVRPDMLTRDDVENMIFNNIDLDSLFGEVEGLIGFRRKIVDRPTNSLVEHGDKLSKIEIEYKNRQQETDHEKFMKFKRELKAKNIPYRQKVNELYGYGLSILKDRMERFNHITNKKLLEQGRRLDDQNDVIKALQQNGITLDTKIDENSRIMNLMARQQTLDEFKQEIDNKLIGKVSNEEIEAIKNDFANQINNTQASLSTAITNLNNNLQTKLNQNDIKNLIDTAINKSVKSTDLAIKKGIQKGISGLNIKAKRLFNAGLLKGYNNNKELYDKKFNELTTQVNLNDININNLDKLFQEFQKGNYISRPLFDDEVNQIKKSQEEYRNKMAVLEGRFSEFGLNLSKLKAKLEQNPNEIEQFNVILNLLKKNHGEVSNVLLDDFQNTMEKVINQKDYVHKSEISKMIEFVQGLIDKEGRKITPTTHAVIVTANKFAQTPLGKIMRASYEREYDFNQFVRKAMIKGQIDMFNSINGLVTNMENDLANNVFNIMFNPQSRSFNELNQRITIPLNNKINEFNIKVNALQNSVNEAVNGNSNLVNQFNNQINTLTAKLNSINEKIAKIADQNEINITELTDLKIAKNSIEDKIKNLKNASDLVYTQDLSGMKKSIDFLNEQTQKFLKFYDFVVEHPGEIVENDLNPISQAISSWKKQLINELKPFAIKINANNDKIAQQNWLKNFLEVSKQKIPDFFRQFSKNVGATLNQGMIFFDPDFNPFAVNKAELKQSIQDNPEAYRNVVNSPDGSAGRMILSNFMDNILSFMKDQISPGILDYVYNNLKDKEKQSAKVIGLTRNIVKQAIVDAAGKSEYKDIVESNVDDHPVLHALDNSIKDIKTGVKHMMHKYPRRLVVNPWGDRYWFPARDVQKQQSYKMLFKAIEEFWQMDPANTENMTVERANALNAQVKKIQHTAKMYGIKEIFPTVNKEVSEPQDLIVDDDKVKAWWDNYKMDDELAFDFATKDWKFFWNDRLGIPVPVAENDDIFMFKGQPLRIAYGDNDKGKLVPYDWKGKGVKPYDPNVQKQWVFYDERKKKARDAGKWYETMGNRFKVDEMNEMQLVPFAMQYNRLKEKEDKMPKLQPEGYNIEIVNPPEGFGLQALNGTGNILLDNGKTLTFNGNSLEIITPKSIYQPRPEHLKEFIFEAMDEYDGMKRQFKDFVQTNRKRRVPVIGAPGPNDHDDIIIETEKFKEPEVVVEAKFVDSPSAKPPKSTQIKGWANIGPRAKKPREPKFTRVKNLSEKSAEQLKNERIGNVNINDVVVPNEEIVNFDDRVVMNDTDEIVYNADLDRYETKDGKEIKTGLFDVD